VKAHDDGAAPHHPLPPMPEQAWLELFYDLVFVAAIIVLSSAYSKDYSWAQTAWLLVVFSLMWSTWLTTTLLLNRITLQGPWLRSLLVTQMFLVLMMAVFADDHLLDHTEYVGPTFALILVVVALMYRAALGHEPELQPFIGGRAGRCLLAAVLFSMTPVMGEWWYLGAWVAGLLLVVLPARGSAHHARLDAPHLVHRFGEFTIVMLGEGFVKIGLVATEEPLDRVDLIGLPLTFVLVYAIWWLYFTDIPRSGLPSGRGRRTTWMLGHFPMHLCITAFAVGMSKLLLPTAHALGPKAVRFVTVPLTVIVLSLALLNWTMNTPGARRREVIHLYSSVALTAVWVVLYALDTHDLEATALLVTAVLAVSAWRIRRIPDAPGRRDDDP